MSAVESDEFYAGLLDLQFKVSEEYAKQVGRLRAENRALRKTIAEFPSGMSELQDRVTLLETRLACKSTIKEPA